MRIKELDALRGIAALAVVFYHFTTRYNEIFNKEFAFNFAYGWLGVPVFFILSGFVIYLTVNKSNTVLNFFKKRFLRLYPTYWICLLITLSIEYFSGFFINSLSSLDIVLNFTMFQQFLGFKHVDGAYWSLLPELLFYILMAGLMLIKKQNNFYLYNGILILLGAIHVLLPLPIIGKLIAIHYILLFMIGIAFYRIYNHIHSKIDYVLIFLNWIVGTKLYHLEHHSTTLLFLYSAFLLIIGLYFLFINGKLKFLAKSKMLMFLGYISYTLYLIHQNIGYIIINLTESYVGRFFAMILAIFVALGLATLITYKIEPIVRNLIAFKNDKNGK